MSDVPPTPLPKKLTMRFKKEVERPDVGVRLIIIFKCVKATLCILVALGSIGAIHHDVHAFAEGIVRWFRIDPASERVEHLLAKLTGLTTAKLAGISAGALVFAGVLLTEAWGLHKRRVWAEWLTIGLTSSLIPVEVYELVVHASPGKAGALLINVVVVIYLARHHFLFMPGPLGRWLNAHFGSSPPPPRLEPRPVATAGSVEPPKAP
jgi:uncharacterized membrane protein (DUF2068 family)